jgi:hypothetical protein
MTHTVICVILQFVMCDFSLSQNVLLNFYIFTLMKHCMASLLHISLPTSRPLHFGAIVKENKGNLNRSIVMSQLA